MIPSQALTNLNLNKNSSTAIRKQLKMRLNNKK